MNPQTLADRWLVMDRVRIVSGLILAMVVGLAVAQIATFKPGGSAFGPVLGGDYGEFYAVGMLLNREPVGRLYDLRLQDQLLHEALPAMSKQEQLPFAYPPFLAPVFRPLARLPFASSYSTWLVLSLALYSASVALMLRGVDSLSTVERSTVWLLALSFEPFAIECWMGGQLSALGCLAVACGLSFRGANCPFLCGIALSTLLYKPSLPLLIVPLLLVGRRWRILGGFVVGAVVLGLISLGVEGESACRDFVRLMAGYGREGASASDGFKTIKYVDLRAFLGLLGFSPGVASPLALLLGLPAAAGLALAWSRAAEGPKADLAWSAALCFTPILNLYGPVYDVSLIVPGLILAAATIPRGGGQDWPPAFRWLLAIVYVAAWTSPGLAQGVGFQPLTVALAAMGAYLLRESLRHP